MHDIGDADEAILRHFIQPAIKAGHGGDIKNLYNLYVYFWRWALWKVFEQKGARGPGVVSFISASSYVTGDAFAGMRQHMREICDEIWIIDLGGEGRGARQSENVFDIKTPVAIAIAVCYHRPCRGTAAVAHYARIEGSRRSKLDRLAALDGFEAVEWHECPADWQAPFRPAGAGRYFGWPLLTDLFPWQHSGLMAGRTWVVAPTERLLQKRWSLLRACGSEAKKRGNFKESPTGRKAHYVPRSLIWPGGRWNPILEADEDEPCPPVIRFSARSLDRQYVFADTRMLDRPGPPLWWAHGERQVYVASLLYDPLGHGPALMASALLPDKHFFSGRGARDVVPLWRDHKGTRANVAASALTVIAEQLGCAVPAEDLLAYTYGCLAHPLFSEHFRKELESCELRVPVTRVAQVFRQVRDVGRRLLWLHTYGQRFVPPGETPGRIADGKAKCTKAVPDDPERYPDEFGYDHTTKTLRVGQGELHPVDKGVWEFEVSGLQVVKSWLRYRMRRGYGRKSSPLDDIRPERWTAQFTTELLELLWVLEHTLALYPKQAELLDAVLDGPLFHADDFPAVPDEMRKPPKRRKQKGLWDDA